MYGRRVVCLGLLVLCLAALAACGSSTDRAQSYYKHGVELATAGDLAKAGLEFRNALKLDAKLTDAQFALGDVEERQAHYDVAAKIYAAIAEQDPKHIQARVRLAYILIGAGQVDAALKYAEEAVSISGVDADALVVKAAVELKLNNRGEAVRLAKAALDQRPQFTEALMVLAAERLMASDPAGAMTFLSKAPADRERDIGLQTLRLTALDALNDQPGVEQLYRKLIDLFPDNPAFRDALVNWYVGKGRNSDAEREVRTFAATNPGDVRAQLKLVSFVDVQAGHEAAIAELAKLIAAQPQGDPTRTTFQSALARLQFAIGQQPQAMALIKTAISESTDLKATDAMRLDLAGMALQTADYAQAEQLADQVLADDSKNTAALATRASVRLTQGKSSAAIDDLLAALNEAPDDARLHALLAQAYERDGSVSLAYDQYGKAFDLSQNSPEVGLAMAHFLMGYGRTDEALHVLEAAESNTPNNRDVLALIAQLKLGAQDWVGAQQAADKLRTLDKSGNDTTADRIVAAALGGLKKYDDSVDLLQKSISTSGNQQGVLADLIASYVRAGRQPDAAAFLENIIKSQPDDVQAQTLLGGVYVAMGKPDLAEGTFKSAAAVDRGGAGNASLAQFYMSKGRFADAETAARAGLAKDAKSTALHLLLAGVLQQMERFDDAIGEYEQAFTDNPQSPLVANDLASLLSERRGDQASLDRAYDIAKRFSDSNIPEYLDTLGWIYYLRGDYPSALRLEQTAAEKLPQIALVQYHLGMVLDALGQSDRSVASLKTAISLSPPLIESDLAKAHTVLSKLQTPTPASSTN